MEIMISIYVILGILLVHWFADFVLQTDKEAKGKSENWSDLLSHTWNYSVTFYAVGVVLIVINMFYPFFVYKPWSLSLFVLSTFIAHTATDYFTSRVNSQLWKEEKVHDFFVSVGFDQWLHYAQLFICFKLIVL